MHLRISTIMTCTLFFSIEAYSQANVVIWQSQSIKDLRNNEENLFTCTFKIYQGDRIEWVQGSRVSSFQVTSTEGDLSEEGLSSVTYNLTKEGKSGKVIVERTNGNDILLTLDLSEGTGLGAYFSFKVFNP